MTYGDFLDTLISPIQAFLSWATTITTALLGNYFFITLVGIVVITSLFYLVIDLIQNFKSFNKSNKKNLDNGGKKQ